MVSYDDLMAAGSVHKAREAGTDRLEGREDIRNHRIFITHPHCPERDVETAREAIEKYQSFDEIIETHAGCTVSSHCGPRTLGVQFIRK